MLNRPLYSYWGVRDGKDWQWPPIAQVGPKVMLINSWSGSGGDAFPFFFKEAGVGPLIGTRTWGGLIGISGVPPLIDGGGISVPTFGIYSLDGEWIIEGHGVDPDIEVIDDPSQLARGTDPQLERAIAEVMRMLEENPPTRPSQPAPPRKSGR
jgi:tricorn protease